MAALKRSAGWSWALLRQPPPGGLQLRGSWRVLQCKYLSMTPAKLALRPPANLVINFVPQQQAWIVERFGKYLTILKPGLNILIPVVDQIRYVQSLKEKAIDIPSQSAITEDNVTLHLDGVLYYRVVDPYKASYGVEDAEFAVMQLAQTTMRSELGKIKLDSVFQERTNLNLMIVEAINHAAEAWGLRCLRYEIKDIQLPSKVKEAMQMQVEAERKKRANILESEGVRESAINRAEGLRQSKILASEAMQIEQVNKARGEAAAILARALARAQALRVLGQSLGERHGSKAASLSVAEQYVQAFSLLAKTNNTLILPEKTGDVGSMVAQAMAIFGHMTAGSTDPDPSGTASKAAPSSSFSSPSVTNVTGTSMIDLEASLESLSRSIEESISPQAMLGEIGQEEKLKKSPEEPPHFTLASSPTRHMYKDMRPHTED